MKFAIVLVYLVACAAAKSISDGRSEFESFKQKHGKSYENALDEAFHFKAFRSNLKIIAEHNEQHKLGKVSFKLGVNQFADLTINEYRTKILGSQMPHLSKPRNVNQLKFKDAPDSIDWRDKGYVTPVVDQGQCGAAWTFATTGALEGQNFNATGTLVKLSEQNLADCTYGVSIGCSGGGNIDDGFQYVIDNGGIDTEGGYPAPAIPDGQCHYDPEAIGGTASSYVDVASKDEDALKEATGNIGPVATYIDASHTSFQLYVSGVYYEPNCSEDQLDHTGLIVGYGSEDGNDYWILKNTWGVSWGEQGYVRMARNQNNNCGIATSASYPLV